MTYRLCLLLMLSSLLAASDVDYADSDARPMLGVQMSPVPTRVLQQQDLTPDTGVYVRRTYNGTAAQDLGVRSGDVIVEINQNPINSMSDLRREVMGSQVGEPVEVVVRRDGEDVVLSGSTYQEWPEDIPYGSIDARAEARYRANQMRYLAGRQDRIADLQNTEADLRNQMAPLREALDNAEDGRRPAGIDRFGQPRIGAIALPPGLLALPAWRFAFVAEVADAHVADGDQNTSAAATHHRSAGSPLAVTFSIDVGTEVSPDNAL